jgi:hypothetical protein
MNMIYRGSYPAPRIEHGQIIPGYGMVLARERVFEGWEYRCLSDKTPVTIFCYESDEMARRARCTIQKKISKI